MRLCLLTFVMTCFFTSVNAQVVETGRWQELNFSAVEVHHSTEKRYRQMLADLAATNQLDDDVQFTQRAKKIMAGIVLAAIALQPRSAHWDWEIHTSSDPGIEALCLAGGKILIGSQFSQKLQLNDGELATLIAHEVAHAVAEHQREEISEAFFIKPLPNSDLELTILRLENDMALQIRLFKLSNLQEIEADQIGAILSHRAGWPGVAMLSFYQKLKAIEEPSLFTQSHPTAATRLSMAKGMALLLRGL
jgi:predicted Zn-dependent protease